MIFGILASHTCTMVVEATPIHGGVNGEWAMVNRYIAYSSLPIHEKTTNLISRILFLNHHLSGRNIAVTILLPTLDRSYLA